MGTIGRRSDDTVLVPGGVSVEEALLVLGLLGRLKEHRFGRITLSVSDGRVVDIEVIEKIDRALFQAFGHGA